MVGGSEVELKEVGIPAAGIPAGAQAKLAVSVPEQSSVVDLSETATANCYVINKAATTYKFRADVMGNGATTPNITPTTIAPTKTRLMKEYMASGSYKGGTADGWSDDQMNMLILRTSVQLKTEGGVPYVYFTTPATLVAGNAIICVTDDSDVILWSWHLWITPDYTLGSGDVALSANTACSGVTMMDRNLGALSSGPNDNTTYSAELNARAAAGLAYQWGRKDPFQLLSVGLIDYNNINGYMQSADGTITQIRNDGEVYGVWSQNDVFQLTTTDIAASIAASIQNPDKRYKNNAGTSTTDYSAPWALPSASASSSVVYKSLWGNPTGATTAWAGVKTIYDPCPVGYRVPGSDAFGFFTRTGANLTTASAFSDSSQANFDQTATPFVMSSTTITSINFSTSYGFYFYAKSTRTSSQTDADRADQTKLYFPACGYIMYNGSSRGTAKTQTTPSAKTLQMVCNKPAIGNPAGVHFGYNSSYIDYHYGYDYPAAAQTVRCIKE